jgi:hypothetical protein
MQHCVPERVYHFTSYDKFVNYIAANNTLRFGSPLDFNDPFDSFIEMYPMPSYEDSVEFMHRIVARELPTYAAMSHENWARVTGLIEGYKTQTRKQRKRSLESFARQNASNFAKANAQFLQIIRRVASIRDGGINRAMNLGEMDVTSSSARMP